jgi:hypothetical protein
MRYILTDVVFSPSAGSSTCLNLLLGVLPDADG